MRKACHRSVSLVEVVLLVMVLACMAQPGQCAATLLATPQWKIGDWFELKVSTWRGPAVAAPSEKVAWSAPVTKRYTVEGEETLFGYPCFVVRESWKRDGTAAVEGDQYFFRKSDLALLRVRVAVRLGSSEDSVKWVEEYGESPRVVGDIGLAPRFPVLEGWAAFPSAPVTDADGRVVARRSEAEHWERPVRKTQGACRDTFVHGKGSVAAVQVEASDRVCRWVPGQLWWAQCWQEQKRVLEWNGVEETTGSTYRAALYATSRDGILDYPLPEAATGGVILERKTPCLPEGSAASGAAQ